MSAPCADETFKKGMDMIFQSFMNTLSGLNVEMIGVPGETFDPNLHNAVMHIEDEQYGDNEIVQVLQKGYRIGDRVVRYAMVQVAN
jgi:molecular chaperone GrpE